ncbi:MAG: 23S rRNA (uracil(1939)-C(5))-methyltransferase RlmD [Candidatus Pacearchaeota archaeon]
MKEIILEFQKITANGQALGFFNKKAVFCYGVLPQEIAKVKILKEKKDFIITEPIEIIKKNNLRIKPKESHYLSCSPFQICQYEFEKQIKKEIIKEILKNFQEDFKINEFYFPKNIYQYRTKLEFSFIFDKKINLAFFKRNHFFEKIKTKNGCLLGSKEMNKIALEIIKILNEEKIPFDILKSLTIRESKNEKNFLVILTIKKEKKININYQKISQIQNLKGFILNYSSFKTPATTFEKIVKIYGDDFLKEKIKNLVLFYSYDCFFQNNLEMFELALDKITQNLNFYEKPTTILELYSGVGTIGLNLKNYAKKIIGVEEIKNAVQWAIFNKKINNCNNYFPIFNKAEKVLDLLKEAQILILDPPRSGLNKKILKKIIEFKPKVIIYLSCQPLTQIRDYKILKENYNLKNFYVFDFYPRTPHLETLMILETK